MHLVFIAVLEGLVTLSLFLRIAMGGLDLGQTPTLAWFVVTMTVAAGSLAQFVVRSSMAAQQAPEGEVSDDQRRAVLITAVMMLALAAGLSALGPAVFARVLGK
jgi:hypothetical protein